MSVCDFGKILFHMLSMLLFYVKITWSLYFLKTVRLVFKLDLEKKAAKKNSYKKPLVPACASLE